MRQLLTHRGFRRLLVGQAISSFGDWMGTLALMYFVLELSGSTTAVGGVLVLRLLPSAVGAPLAARVVVRWDRRQVMLRADLIRAGMAVLLPMVPWLGWVFGWAFAIEVVSLAFLPARDAAVPVLVDGDDRERQLALANGLVLVRRTAGSRSRRPHLDCWTRWRRTRDGLASGSTWWCFGWMRSPTSRRMRRLGRSRA